MEYVGLIGAVIVVHLLALISPGPDFIMAVRNSLKYSRRTGMWTAIGFGLGIGVHISYCIAGLALIISKSILLFNTIKLLGAAYLIYIGIKSLTSKASTVEVHAKKQEEISPLSAVWMGFLTNVLNPKATLFFLGLFTLVISPETPAFVLGIVSAAMILATMIWFSLVAVFLTHRRIRIIFYRWQAMFDKVLGGLLVGLGVKVALTEN